MPHYKLTYFNARARGEVSRLLFAIAGVEYEDFRIKDSLDENWPEVKANAPFGQIPVLEVDGKKLCQSNCIARYLANKFGLAGKNDWEKAEADMIVDCVEDIVVTMVDIFHELNDARKQELKQTLKDKFPTYVSNLEKLLKQNHGGDGYFVGDSLTWADLTFFNLFGWADSNGVSIPLNEAPKLKALKERVERHPKVAEWVAKRPQTLV